MIDCHAHAAPSLGEQVDRPLQAFGAPGGLRAAAHLASGLVGRLVGKVARAGALELEDVAGLRERLSVRTADLLERTLSLAGLPVVAAAAALENLFSSMDRHGIARAVVLPLPPLSDNDWLLGPAVDQAASRIVPVAVLPALAPNAPLAAWVDAYRDLAERGARGFKIHPNLDGLPPAHPAYRALFEVAAERDRFVILHTGHFGAATYKRPGPADPTAFLPLFEAFPAVRVCLAHMNRGERGPVFALMRKFGALYTDTSWQTEAGIREALAEVGSERLLLGSDWPLLHAGLQGDALAQLRKAVSAAELEAIGEANARRFFGEA